jgi:hypothetical protein
VQVGSFSKKIGILLKNYLVFTFTGMGVSMESSKIGALSGTNRPPKIFNPD